MICGKTELCIFDRPSPQAVIEYGTFEEVFPTNSISEMKNDLEFTISGSQTEYLDLNDTLLYVQLQVLDKHRKELDEKSDVIPTNYLFYAMFKDVVLSLNNIKVEGGNDHYIQKAMIETILNYNGDCKNICLGAIGYRDQEAGKNSLKSSKPISLCGPLQLDFMDQPKYLIPGVNVHIRLKRAAPKMCFESANDEPKYALLDAKLMVRRVRVESSVLAGHQIGLTKQNAIYPMRIKEMVNHAISKDSSSFYKEQIFNDRRLPNFLLVTFQTADQFNDGYKALCSKFSHFNVKSITLSKNSDFRETYTQDFENNDYSTSYMQSIVRNLGYLNKNMNCGITLDEFKSDYPFFTFVLAPDFDINQSQLPQQGNLKLDMKFGGPLKAPAYVLIYRIFEGEIQIIANRTVLA